MADSIRHGTRVETPGPELPGGELEDFYAITPADMQSATPEGHAALIEALARFRARL